MRALTWHGKADIRCESVPDPKIEHPRYAIINIFERADMMDTKIGQQKKDDAGEVARAGFEAMMKGTGQVVTGWDNKLCAAIAYIVPADALAEMHRGMAQPEH